MTYSLPKEFLRGTFYINVIAKVTKFWSTELIVEAVDL